jgi:Tfp pilus assembly protein PilF
MYDRALESQPGYGEAHREFGWSLLPIGRLPEALAQMKRSVALDPDSGHAHHSLSYAYHCNRQYRLAKDERLLARSSGHSATT